MERTAAVPSQTNEIDTGSQTHPESKEISNFPEERVDIYSKNHGKPYAAKYFEITEYKDLKADSRLDVNGLLAKVSDIEEYVQGLINEKGLYPTTKSFDFLMEEILTKIGKFETEEGHYKLDRIHTYISKYKEYAETEKKLKELQELIYGPKTNTSLRTGEQKPR